MIGDPSTIHALARAVRVRADEIEHLARHLAHAAETVAWQGAAADAMRASAHHSARGLRRTAVLHRDAADALDTHARHVGRALDTLDDAAHSIGHALGHTLGHTLGHSLGHALRAAG